MDTNDEPVITVGAKVRETWWLDEDENYTTVTAVGRELFLAVDARHRSEVTYQRNGDWVRYVEPPTVVEIRNVWAEGIGASRHTTRAKADEADLHGRIAVVTVYTDGTVEVEDTRP